LRIPALLMTTVTEVEDESHREVGTMTSDSSLRAAQTVMHLVSWAQAARVALPAARHHAHQVVQDRSQYTLIAEETEFHSVRIQLFRGAGLVCEVGAADCQGRLAVTSTTIIDADACGAFMASPDDFNAPLTNDSFEPF
jgi:hypothetical protein